MRGKPGDDWHTLLGRPMQYAGVSGTVTVGPGEVLIQVIAHASGNGASVQIFGGPSIPIVNAPTAAPTIVQDYHTDLQVNAGSNQIIFTGTDMYYVQTVREANA